jgi:hypothetical protein
LVSFPEANAWVAWSDQQPAPVPVKRKYNVISVNRGSIYNLLQVYVVLLACTTKKRHIFPTAFAHKAVYAIMWEASGIVPRSEHEDL